MFSKVNDLRRQPIPSTAALRAARQGARAWPIDFAAAAQGEPLVDIAEYGVSARNYYAHERNPPYWSKAPGAIDCVLVRRGVAERLAHIDEALKNQGFALHLHDGWRPIEVQRHFHDVWLPAQLRIRRPDLEGEALAREVERYWAAPTVDASSPAPHATGAAVDLTLTFADGEPLWFGSLFDDASPLAHLDRFEGAGEDFAFSDEEARANRRALFWIMSEAGFAPHPDEWWHYSYGDQTWAKVKGVAAAAYGLAAP
jgi:D-alanyl-D-alanine dipeptidase